MNITTTLLHTAGRTSGRVHARRDLGLAVIAVALLGAAACGSDTTTQNGAELSTTRPTTIAVTATSSIDTVSSTTVNPPRPTATSPSTPATPQETTAAAPARPTETIDQRVGPAGAQVHVRCVGQGDTTVVLIAGFGGDLAGWADVEPVVAERARVCSYDRPGTGTSDPASATTLFSTQAVELHELLRTIGEPGPYLAAGHSFGGAQAITFATRFPDEVVGLVLVDASPTTWPAVLCAVPDDGTDGAAMLRGTCASAFLPTGNGEHLDVAAAFAEVSGITSLDSLPLTVITATERELPADLAASERARLTEQWNQGQQAWVALSTTAHLVSVADTSHNIQVDQPGVVIDEITRLLP